MSRFFAWLPCLAALVVAGRAEALSAGVPYAATVDGSPVGTLRFQLEAQIPGGACRYDAAWDFGEGIIFGEQCILDEALSVGHFSCPRNALGPIPSIVVLAPAQDCQGFDGTGQSNPVFMMLLGESASTGALQGLIQFSAATQSVSAFHAAPMSLVSYLVSPPGTSEHTPPKPAP
jgi:hypothetical protein